MELGISLGLTRLGNVGFSPASLFTGGVQGAWYDPSDYSTLFQDSAGTTPVTAVEQPVGLMLDKSQGLVIGPELITNGGPFTTTTGWTAGNNAVLSATGGRLRVTNNVTDYGQAGISFTTVAGTWYAVTFSSFVGTSGFFRLTVGSSVGSPGILGENFSADTGTITRYFLATGTTTWVTAQCNTTNDTAYVELGSMSVKSIAGNHASQATAASRPVLRARYNLLTYSEQFDNAGWAKSTSTVTANTVTAPDGTTTADTLVLTNGGGSSQLYQSTSVINGTVTVSVWLRADAPVTLDFGFFDSAGDAGAINVTTEWQRFTRTRTAGLTSADRRACWLYKGSAGGATVYIWGAQLVTGSSAGTYQRIAAATDYATAGFAPYLAPDGTDDFLGAAYVQSAYPLTLAAGINNDSISVTNGAFVSVAQSDTVYKVSRDNLVGATDAQDRNAATNTTGGIAQAGNKFVLSQFETSLITQQVNSGTANTIANANAFGTSANIFIGKIRPAGLFSQARIYGVVVTNSVLSASQVASLRSWMGGKMGVTL